MVSVLYDRVIASNIQRLATTASLSSSCDSDSHIVSRHGELVIILGSGALAFAVLLLAVMYVTKKNVGEGGSRSTSRDRYSDLTNDDAVIAPLVDEGDRGLH